MRPIKKGSTDQSVVIRIIDSTDFTPEQAVEHNTAGIDLWYRREGATRTAITEAALATLDAAHSDGGIEHIDDGYYRLDLPDAAVDTGANGVMVGGAVTGMIVIGAYIPLVDYDPYDAVRMGMTALPSAAADAAGGLIISDDGGFDTDAIFDHANYGLAKLVRSTTPANTLTVDANGEVTVPDDQRVLLANSNDHGGATAGITLNGANGLTSSTGITAGITGNITGNLSGSIGTVSAGGIDNAAFDADVGTTAYVGNPIAIATAKALVENHLDHLFAADYDPAAKPGNATALLNEIVENDGGVSRFTANALEQAPSGGTNPNVLVDTTIAGVTNQTVFTLTAGSSDDDAYNDQAIVLYDASVSDYPSVRKISDYVGATRTVTIDSDPDFTIVSGDGVKVFVTAPGTTAPTTGQIADAVWDEDQADHVGAGTFGVTASEIADILTDTGTTLDTLIKDIPTVAEFEARSLPSADYTVVGDLGTVQTGDSFARLGAPVGVSISADIATVDGNVDAILTDTSTTLDTLIKDIPTVAEFEARSLPSADYTVVGDLGVVQTGDSFAIVNGDHGLVSIQDDIDAILVDTGTTLDTDIQSVLSNQTVIDNEIATIDANVDTLIARLTATRAGYLDYLMIALVNKMNITEANGNIEQFNDSDVSLGPIAAAFSSNSTTTTRKRMVI